MDLSNAATRALFVASNAKGVLRNQCAYVRKATPSAIAANGIDCLTAGS